MEGITGTLVHYARICLRKIWLMAPELGPEGERELRMALSEVHEVLQLSLPPRWISHCRGCAYAEFCWADLGAAEESSLAGPKGSGKSKG